MCGASIRSETAYLDRGILWNRKCVYLEPPLCTEGFDIAIIYIHIRWSSGAGYQSAIPQCTSTRTLEFDDCILYRQIRTPGDCTSLQQDITRSKSLDTVTPRYGLRLYDGQLLSTERVGYSWSVTFTRDAQNVTLLCIEDHLPGERPVVESGNILLDTD